MRLLVAVPCLNEAESIGRVIEAIPESIPGVDRISVLVVDDGSTDETAAIAGAAGAEVISHGANIGVGSSFQTALRYAIAHDCDLMVNIFGRHYLILSLSMEPNRFRRRKRIRRIRQLAANGRAASAQ